jgi:hypothetical protein
MGRTARSAVVTTDEHDLVGARVVGNFGDGEVRAVRWCALWDDKQVGILYDNEDEIHEAGVEGELFFEDLGEVEVLGVVVDDDEQ